MTQQPNTTPGTPDPAARGSVERLRDAIIHCDKVHARQFGATKFPPEVFVADRMRLDALAAVEREIAELRRDHSLDGGCLDMVREQLVALLGEEDMKHTPAMMYPEAIRHAIRVEVERATAALEAERDELRKDAARWSVVAECADVATNEDANLVLVMHLWAWQPADADGTMAESAHMQCLTPEQRESIDGDAPPYGCATGVDAVSRVIDHLLAEKAKATEAQHG